MNLSDYKQYWVWLVLAGFLGFRFYKSWKVKKMLPHLVHLGAHVVDVRSKEEFALGAAEGSINIPLNEISQRIHELDKTRPIVLCCASGARSGIAAGLLRKNGFSKVFNAGAWRNVNLRSN